MTKSAEDVEREVEATRGNLDRTVEAIKDKMTAPQIFDEVVSGLGSTSTRLVNGLGDQVRENPVPVALIGLGLAWMVASAIRGRDSAAYERRSFSGDSYGGADPYYGEAEQRYTEAEKRSLKDRAAETLQSAKGRISEAVAHVGDTPVAERAHALAGSAVDAADAARRRAQQTFSNTLEHDPLIIGAVGVVVGAAIGAALPSTPIENRYAGPLRDKVLDKTRTLANDGLDGVRHATGAAYTTAKSELIRQEPGAEPAPLADKAANAVRAGLQAAQQELQNRPH
jgi:hypothetical protein